MHSSLEVQLKAAAGGRSDGLLGVLAEVVAHQPATGRCKRERARTSRHPTRGAKEGVAAVHAACGDVGRSGGLSVCACWVCAAACRAKSGHA